MKNKTVKQIWKESAGQGQYKRRELVKAFLREKHGDGWQEQYREWSARLWSKQS